MNARIFLQMVAFIVHTHFLHDCLLFVILKYRQSSYVTLKSLFQFKHMACALIGCKHVKTYLHQIVTTELFAIKVES